MTTPDNSGANTPDPGSIYSNDPNAPSPASPVATQAPPYAPKKASGLTLAALIVGIVAFLVGLAPIFGALVGLTAVVLGILALRRHQSKGMAIAGVVLGAIATLASIGMTAGIGAAVNNASDESPVAAVSEPSTEPSTQAPIVEPEPTETVAPAPAAPAVPADFQSALIKAASYSELMNMSRAGIYDQLTSEYGEQFSPEAAQYAVDNLQADWNANALAKAKSYQEQMAMSPDAIRDQLTSEYGEKFTPEEADYAMVHLND